MRMYQIFFFQPENDYDLAPSRVLSAAMKSFGKKFEMRIYPPFGKSNQEGHSFSYLGSSVWADDVFRFLEQNCGKLRLADFRFGLDYVIVSCDIRRVTLACDVMR